MRPHRISTTAAHNSSDIASPAGQQQDRKERSARNEADPGAHQNPRQLTCAHCCPTPPAMRRGVAVLFLGAPATCASAYGRNSARGVGRPAATKRNNALGFDS